MSALICLLSIITNDGTLVICEGTHQEALGSSSPFGLEIYSAQRDDEGYQTPPMKVK
jgi:hypothetical protein